MLCLIARGCASLNFLCMHSVSLRHCSHSCRQPLHLCHCCPVIRRQSVRRSYVCARKPLRLFASGMCVPFADIAQWHAAAASLTARLARASLSQPARACRTFSLRVLVVYSTAPAELPPPPAVWKSHYVCCKPKHLQRIANIFLANVADLPAPAASSPPPEGWTFPYTDAVQP